MKSEELRMKNFWNIGMICHFDGGTTEKSPKKEPVAGEY